MSYRIKLSRSPLILAAFVAAAVACGSDTENVLPPVGTQLSIKEGSDAQTGAAGSALTQPISVHVTDASGTASSGTTVTWTVATGGGTTSAATSVANATGDATTTWTLGTTAGANTVTASIPAGASVTIHATATAAAAATVTKVSGDAQTIAVGTASVPLVIKVVDQYGNPVSGATVAWTSTGGGTLTSMTVTDADGQAPAMLTADVVPAAYTVTATVGTLTPVTFTITAN